MKKLLFLLLAIAVFTSSCDKEGTSEKVCASVASNKLKITNHSPVPVYYFVVERNAAALINWAKSCSDQNKIDASGSVTIDLGSIYGYTADSELIVHWWRDCSTLDNLENLIISTKGLNNTCSP